MSDNVLLPQYTTKTFCQIWEEEATFLSDYKNSGIPPMIEEANARTLYYLLYARYGNNPIANADINQFKYKVFSIIFQSGPSWEKRLDIQSKVRNMTEDEFLTGSKQVYNHAYNPSTQPSTDATNELNYIDNQNVTKATRGKLEGYSFLLDLIKTDVTEEFINKFKNLFKTFVSNEHPLLYVTEEEE